MTVMALTTAPVVQNDKIINKVGIKTSTKKAASSAQASASTIGSNLLKKLESKRQEWEITAYRTSNQQLYAILAECLDYGQPLEFGQAKQRAKELDVFLSERGYVVKKESPLMTRIVKAVFGNVDRRRISTYSLVLRSAQAESIKPAGLADWIEQRGGIQEIKLTRSSSYVSPKQKAERAKSQLEDLPNLAEVKAKLVRFADADFIGTECVLLAEQQADGSFHIKALTRSATAVNAALAALYAEQMKAAA
jgi:hypothetical protein